MTKAYKNLKSELNIELTSILNYWCENTLDNEYGGFVGRINHYNKVIPKASKGIIFNARILWSFSKASNHLKTTKYRTICDKAYTYLKKYFNDSKHKGVYWELDYLGSPINRRKQVYAQAFTIYALSEYYLFSKKIAAKEWAIELFNQIEEYAKDADTGGYIEAFNEDWSYINDMRLSAKDMNAAKTMNTHLHILEAYTSLLNIYDNQNLKAALKQLIELFLEKFFNEQHHYELFYDESWNLMSNTVSYGHDIETAWLLIDASKAVEDEILLDKIEIAAIQVTNTFLKEAIDSDGAVLNEKNRKTGVVDTDRHWWPQVEALIGLNYAYNLKLDQKYIDHSLKIWDFTKNHLIDHENGEWYFRVDKNGKVYAEEDKVSMWKAPYHITRACILLNI